MTGTCKQHNLDIDNLKTLEEHKQREELNTKIQTSRMQTLLADNQNKSKTTKLDKHSVKLKCQQHRYPAKYMTSLSRKECSDLTHHTNKQSNKETQEKYFTN